MNTKQSLKNKFAVKYVRNGFFMGGTNGADSSVILEGVKIMEKYYSSPVQKMRSRESIGFGQHGRRLEQLEAQT